MTSDRREQQGPRKTATCGDRRELARRLIEDALQSGASSAEVLIHEGPNFSTVVRMGAVEKLIQSNSRKLGLRVFQGTRSALFSTSDFSPEGLRQVVRDTLELAQAAGEDPCAGISSGELCARDAPDMRLCFPAASLLSIEQKIALARECEEASLRYDPRICNSEGAGFSDAITSVTYANSGGVCGRYERSACMLYASPLAEDGGQKQRDYWLTTHPDLTRLQSPREVGVEAARRVLRRLGAKRIPTCTAPVIFDPLTAGALLKSIADAVSGTALVRQASFLAGRLGSQVASPLVSVFDDPLLPGGLASRPFDSEGVASRTTPVVRDGRLESYLLDTCSARKLGLVTTGNSNRQPYGAPAAGPSNFYLKPGTVSPDEIISSVKHGLYVTDLIGFGVNVVSGNYSQGAAGIWIEGGCLAFPVEGITIAGNLKDMLTSVEAVGNDLSILGEIFAPTLLIGRMVVSGS